MIIDRWAVPSAANITTQKHEKRTSRMQTTQNIFSKALPNGNKNIMKQYRIVPNTAICKDGKNIGKFIHLFDMTYEDRKSAELNAKIDHGLEVGQYKIVQIDPDISHMCARTETEIQNQITELCDMMWLYRFLLLHMECIENGIQIPLSVRTASSEVETQYSSEELYGLSDFERGKIYGQHSALLWVIGDCRSELTVEAEF